MLDTSPGRCFRSVPPVGPPWGGPRTWDGLGTLLEERGDMSGENVPAQTDSWMDWIYISLCNIFSLILQTWSMSSPTPANQLVSFQIPVACKSCPCGYVFISRKLLNAKLNERSSPAIAGRPFLSLCICACVCCYFLTIILGKDG